MPQMAQAKRRVKVYSYNEDLQWVDKGTGYVMCSYVDRLMALAIVVRSEGDGSVILESKITPDHPYQKQEDTLIVWTESDSCDLALSFQHQAGCDEVWTKICETLGQYSSMDMGQDIEDTLIEEFEGAGYIGRPIELPPCELSKLEEIAKIVKCPPMSVPTQRESRGYRVYLGQAIEQQDYVPKLIELFHMCEDLGNLEGLYHLYDIFRTFFALNREPLLKLMLQQSLIMDVIGCLEYNPATKSRVHHRDYIQSKALFKEIIPFEDKELVGKIHHLYKVIYIQEVILPTPSLFEENLLSALNLNIMCYKSEIIDTIQEDETFLTQLFTQLCDEATDESRLTELARLLKEICNFAQSVKSKDMYQVMKQHGLMSSIESMLMSEVAMVISYAVDILMIMMEFDMSMVKDYIIQQQHQSSGQDDDNQLLLIIVDQLVDSINSDCDVQLVGLIKMLIVPEPQYITADCTTADGTTTAATTTTSSMEKSFFLQNFYKHCMHKLIAPLMAQTTGDTITKDTPSNAILLSHILDILSFCVESHTYHIKNYILNKNLLARVLVLMKSVHSHLALAALRFCRRIVGLKDEQYCRYIIKNNLFDPIIKAFEANGCRYNLLNSAIIELFEYIRYEDIKLLVEYFVDKFSGLIDSVDYVSTFKKLMLRHEQELDRIENGESEQQSQTPQGIIHGVDRYRLDPHAICDDEEEKWFNDEEESITPPLEENVNSIPSALLSTTPPASLPGAPSLTTSFFSPSESSDVPFLHPTTHFGPFPSFVGSPRPPIKIKPINIEQKYYTSVSPALQSLVEYDDEDSDEEEMSQETASPAKKQRLEVSLET